MVTHCNIQLRTYIILNAQHKYSCYRICIFSLCLCTKTQSSNLLFAKYKQTKFWWNKKWNVAATSILKAMARSVAEMRVIWRTFETFLLHEIILWFPHLLSWTNFFYRLLLLMYCFSPQKKNNKTTIKPTIFIFPKCVKLEFCRFLCRRMTKEVNK